MNIDSGAFLWLLPYDIIATYQEVFVVLIFFMAEESDVNKFVIWVLSRLLSFDLYSLLCTISLFLDIFVVYAINLAFVVREERTNILLFIR